MYYKDLVVSPSYLNLLDKNKLSYGQKQACDL